MAEQGFEMVRYADDFVILCRSPEEAARALAVVQQWTAEAGLTLHPDKTQIVDATVDTFDFLGYRFETEATLPATQEPGEAQGHDPSENEADLREKPAGDHRDLNPTLRGWFEYFKHSHKTTFRQLDGWIRMRLRSILRKRLGRKGRGRGTDHQRWPNAFFAEHGLYSLKAAHALACQSSSR